MFSFLDFYTDLEGLCEQGPESFNVALPIKAIIIHGVAVFLDLSQGPPTPQSVWGNTESLASVRNRNELAF